MHGEGLGFFVNFFSSDWNLDFLNQWWQIHKINKLFMKKSRCRWVMMREWFIKNGLILALLQSWWEKIIMLLRLVLVYFTTIYTVHSFLFSSPGWCTALLFWFYVSKCIKHYPVPILHNWQRLPNPYEDPLTLLTPYPRTPPPPFSFKFCPTLPKPALFVALFLWLNVSLCHI